MRCTRRGIEQIAPDPRLVSQAEGSILSNQGIDEIKTKYVVMLGIGMEMHAVALLYQRDLAQARTPAIEPRVKLRLRTLPWPCSTIRPLL